MLILACSAKIIECITLFTCLQTFSTLSLFFLHWPLLKPVVLAFPPVRCCSTLLLPPLSSGHLSIRFPPLTAILLAGSLVKRNAPCPSIFILPIYVFPHIAYSASLSSRSLQRPVTSLCLQNDSMSLALERLEKTSEHWLGWCLPMSSNNTCCTVSLHNSDQKGGKGQPVWACHGTRPSGESSALCCCGGTQNEPLNTTGRCSDCQMPAMPLHLSYITAA